MDDYLTRLGQLAERNTGMSARTALFILFLAGGVVYVYNIKKTATYSDNVVDRVHPSLQPHADKKAYVEWKNDLQNPNMPAAFDPSIEPGCCGRSKFKNYELFPPGPTPIDEWAIRAEKNWENKEKQQMHEQFFSGVYEYN